jgi:hypothetical protein
MAYTLKQNRQLAAIKTKPLYPLVLACHVGEQQPVRHQRQAAQVGRSPTIRATPSAPQS